MSAIKSNRIKPSHTNFINSLIFLTIIFAIATISTVIFNKSSIEGFDNMDITDNTDYTDNMDNRLVTVDPLDFMRYNISAPECCKYSSGYSNSTGCICITPTQQKIFNSRGSSY